MSRESSDRIGRMIRRGVVFATLLFLLLSAAPAPAQEWEITVSQGTVWLHRGTDAVRAADREGVDGILSKYFNAESGKRELLHRFYLQLAQLDAPRGSLGALLDWIYAPMLADFRLERSVARELRWDLYLDIQSGDWRTAASLEILGAMARTGFDEVLREKAAALLREWIVADRENPRPTFTDGFTPGGLFGAPTPRNFFEDFALVPGVVRLAWIFGAIDTEGYETYRETGALSQADLETTVKFIVGQGRSIDRSAQSAVAAYILTQLHSIREDAGTNGVRPDFAKVGPERTPRLVARDDQILLGQLEVGGKATHLAGLRYSDPAVRSGAFQGYVIHVDFWETEKALSALEQAMAREGDAKVLRDTWNAALSFVKDERRATFVLERILRNQNLSETEMSGLLGWILFTSEQAGRIETLEFLEGQRNDVDLGPQRLVRLLGGSREGVRGLAGLVLNDDLVAIEPEVKRYGALLIRGISLSERATPEVLSVANSYLAPLVRSGWISGLAANVSTSFVRITEAGREFQPVRPAVEGPPVKQEKVKIDPKKILRSSSRDAIKRFK